MGDHLQVFNQATQAALLMVTATTTIGEENGEFCVTVGPVTRIVAILT